MIEIILLWIGIILKFMIGLGVDMIGGWMFVTGILDDNEHMLIRTTCIFGGLFAVILGVSAILLTLHEYGLLL